MIHVSLEDGRGEAASQILLCHTIGFTRSTHQLTAVPLSLVCFLKMTGTRFTEVCKTIVIVGYFYETLVQI